MCLLLEIRTILGKCQSAQMSDDFLMVKSTHSSSIEWPIIILPFSGALIPSIEFSIQCPFTSVSSELTPTQILIGSNYSLSNPLKERSLSIEWLLFLTPSGPAFHAGPGLGSLASFRKQQRPEVNRFLGCWERDRVLASCRDQPALKRSILVLLVFLHSFALFLSLYLKNSLFSNFSKQSICFWLHGNNLK